MGQTQRRLPLAGVAVAQRHPTQRRFSACAALLKPEAFQACFVHWLASLRAQAAEATGVEQPVFAVDGKTAEGSIHGYVEVLRHHSS
jgi:hypothetical protein